MIGYFMLGMMVLLVVWHAIVQDSIDLTDEEYNEIFGE